MAAAERALAAAPDEPAVLSFLGMLRCDAGDPAAGSDLLRRALTRWPSDMTTRVNLATALIATGALDEAATVCAEGMADARLLRLSGFINQSRGRFAAAAADYEAVVAKIPDDFETWNNLGNVLVDQGNLEPAVEAFKRANVIRPDAVKVHINLSKALAEMERSLDRQEVMRSAASIAPDDAEVQAELGLAESAMHEYPAAETAFRAAIRLSSGFTPAYIELGLLLENLNRIDALEELIEAAARLDINEAEIDFLMAWLLRRRGDFAKAMMFAERVPATINPLRRAQLVAELSDRLGDTKRAFAAFEEMNATSIEFAGPASGASDYLTEVAASAALLTVERVAGWRRPGISLSPPPPVFIMGFPRSGTTLLDTLLMNIPAFHVLEELPVFRQVEHALGGIERLADIDDIEAKALRARYFEALAAISPPPRDTTVIDKYPLHMARVPTIHRIFPDARLIFVERHPCDVVLSCFMSNFQLNRAMRHFTTLEGAAKLYDTVFDAWTRARELLPINVHFIRYERMIDDLEREMRALLDFLDVPWTAAVLDNLASASQRGHIRTASYSQVTEPIYRRSAGRWERYREQMSEVFPILKPWAHRMGYEV